MLNEKDLAAISRISGLIQTQDNRITSHPIYVVESRKRIYGMDGDYCDKSVWLHRDGEGEAEDEELEKLEAEYAKANHIPEECERVGYVDTWNFEAICLTSDAAEAYIERNAHNHDRLRLYVYSGCRSDEWQLVRKMFTDLADLEVE